MSAYNLYKALARRTGVVDPRRVDRALGILMSSKVDLKKYEYGSSKEYCGCPDCRFRRILCKHSIAIAILEDVDAEMERFRNAD